MKLEPGLVDSAMLTPNNNPLMMLHLGWWVLSFCLLGLYGREVCHVDKCLTPAMVFATKAMGPTYVSSVRLGDD